MIRASLNHPASRSSVKALMKMTLFALISLFTAFSLRANARRRRRLQKSLENSSTRLLPHPVSRAMMSLDGQTISFLQPWESRLNIFVRPVNGGEARRLTSEKDRDIQQYVWKETISSSTRWTIAGMRIPSQAA